MAEFEVTSTRKAKGDGYFDGQEATLAAQGEVAPVTGDPLDSDATRKELRQLLEWFFYEKDRQAANRLEMAMDHDFYDNIQYDPEDAAILRERGQMPLVYNEVAPMADWVIGTERRARVDWRVLPRTEDDVDMADTKTKVMKYVSDVNKVPFIRSRAFSDAVKAGVGWMDDGVRDDPTKDILYSRYEDWRNVIHDSACYEHDLEDARYVFRWRWVDEDIALMMFPNRQNCIRTAVEDQARSFIDGDEEDTWYTEQDSDAARSGRLYAAGAGTFADAKRRRVKLIECQYRKPVMTKVVGAGPLRGAILNPNDRALMQAVANTGSMVVDKIMLRVHVAVFTESHMLGMGPSIFRHNKFSLTPVWCYRRGRDRQPYGVIRRVRDIQQDLNKRASKALFMLNTNQIIADEGAVEDWEALRDEADRPDGVIVKKPGKELVIRRDTDGATGQIQMMTLDAQSIQKSAGVSQENLGRQTNAVSGEAIKARQLQGSVVTTEPFDNLRLATQCQGEKQLSNTEQFYTEEKVVRLTGAKGALDWVKINQPEVQADGSVRFLNDVSASMADFVVSEQDYSGTLRQVMFEALNNMATRLPPEVALRMLTIAMEFSDLPNKDEIAEQIRKITGEPDPNKELTPEEQQQADEQAQQQAQMVELQRQTAMNTLAEQQAKIREINARAAKLEAEAGAGGGEGDPAMQDALMQVQSQGAAEIERLTEALRKAQSEVSNRTLQLNREADTAVEVARIKADSDTRVAEIQAASNRVVDGLQQQINALGDQLAERTAAKAKPKGATP